MNLLGKEFSLLLNKSWALLKETKTQTIYSLISFFVSFSLFFVLSVPTTNFLKHRVPFEIAFIQTTPQELFINAVKIGFLGAMFVTIPVVLYHIMKSGSKKITQQQKFKLKKIALASYAVTLLSILFACYAFIPVQLFILLGLNMDIASIYLNIGDFVSFCLGSILVSCLMFNIPLVYFLVRKNSFFSYSEISTVKKQMPIMSLIVALIILATPEMLSIAVLTVIVFVFYHILLFITKDVKK